MNRSPLTTPLRIVKNFGVRFLGRIVAILLSIVAMGMLGRHLGESGYGEYSFWYNLIFLIQLFGDIGLQVIIVQEIARRRDELSICFGDAIVLKTALSASLMFFMGMIACFFVSGPSVDLLLIVTLAAVVGASQDISVWIFRGVEAMEYEALLDVFNEVLRLVLVYLFITNDLGIAFMLGAQLIANVLRALLGLILLFVRGITPSFRIDIPRYRRLLTASIPVGLAMAISVTYNYVNILMLKWLAGPEDIASFNIGLVLTSGFLFLSVTLTTSFFPVFTKFVHERDERTPVLYAQLSKYLFIISAPISIGLFFLAEEIIALVFQQGFTNSIVSLRILSLTLILRFFNRMCRFVFPASDRQRRHLKHEMAGLLTNLAVSVLLIPRLLFLGACLAFTAGEVVLFLLNYLYLARVIGPLPLVQVVIKPILGGLTMGAALLALKGANLYLIIPLGGMTYLGTLFLFRVFSLGELEYIRNLVRR